MGRRRSARAIGALRPTNKAEQSAAEPAEPRAGTEGNASQQSTRRVQNRASVSPALERIRQAARQRKEERAGRARSLEALVVGIDSRKVNFILDADVRCSS